MFKTPEEVVSIGQDVKVKINLLIDTERISLSIKRIRYLHLENIKGQFHENGCH